MELQEQLRRQRVKYIVSSYRLDGDDAHEFMADLDSLLRRYPMPLIELALAETLVDHWATVPMVRGIDFLKQVHEKLKAWECQPIVSTITPEQFQQITGLDPTPVFGADGIPPTQSIVHPS
jgi:hypothetical protein